MVHDELLPYKIMYKKVYFTGRIACKILLIVEALQNAGSCILYNV